MAYATLISHADGLPALHPWNRAHGIFRKNARAHRGKSRPA